jgi:DNA-binding transcriptional LysR family regulator
MRHGLCRHPEKRNNQLIARLLYWQASVEMAISTAQLSRQVSALEKRLNIKLFYRTTRNVSLTEEGRVFYQHCCGVLDSLDAAEQAVSNLHSSPQGRIKLTAPVIHAEQQLRPLVTLRLERVAVISSRL